MFNNNKCLYPSSHIAEGGLVWSAAIWKGGGVALAKICECQSVMLYTLGGYWLGEVFGEYVYRVTKTRVSCIWCCHFLLPFWKGFPHTCALGRFSGRGWKLIYYEQFPKIPILRSGVYVCGVGPGSPPPFIHMHIYGFRFMMKGEGGEVPRGIYDAFWKWSICHHS